MTQIYFFEALFLVFNYGKSKKTFQTCIAALLKKKVIMIQVMRYLWFWGMTLQVFRKFVVDLGSSEPVISMWIAKKVAATGFSSTMAMIRSMLVVEGRS